MSASELEQWLLAEGIRPELDLLARSTVASDLDGITQAGDLAAVEDRIDWNRLLLAGSVLARSESRASEEAALRIATAAITLQQSPEVRDAGALLFEALSNHRAVELAERRELLSPNVEKRLGVNARLQSARQEIVDSVLVESTGSWLRANDFQRAFWQDASNGKAWVSASAPTASGKTFVVLRWLLDQLVVTRAAVSVYLAPTRALVTEIEETLKDLIQVQELKGVVVNSLPLREEYEKARNGSSQAIFVLTQERLHLLANALKDQIVVDILVVDEAHKVGDLLRGVVLQDAVERATRSNPSAKVVFISPATQNPEVLLQDAPAAVHTAAVSSDAPTVLQNLIIATQLPRKPTEWQLSLKIDDEARVLGVVKLPNRPTGFRKRLAFISAAVGAKGGTLVYANGAAEAEEIALLISQLTPSEPSIDPELAALADLSRRGVHRQYQLARFVERRVAFHYGNMPSLLRLEIERLFRIGKIKFLVCTSTLVEGVNLACRTIVLRGPRKGRGKPMEAHDFWNLAGRAGRWGNEFQGNIVCIDPADTNAWPNGIPKRARYPIKRETDTVLAEGAVLADFIAKRNELGQRDLLQSSQLEQVLAYLLSMQLREGSVLDAPFAKRHDPQAIASIQEALSGLAASISVPAEIAVKHPGVSAAGLENLLRYFADRSGDLEDLLPAPAESDDAYQRLIKIMKRINAHVFPAFQPDGLVPLHALVVTEWLRGLSLAAIIQARIRYHQRHDHEIELPKLIRDTMELVEQTARFRAPKYLAAYMDTLKLHLTNVGREDLIPADLDLGLALEFGISTRTLLSLMELGLSRMSAVALYEKMAEDELTQEGCRAWVEERRDELEGLDLPSIIVREIREKVLGERTTAGS